MSDRFDVAVIGAGAAGMMCAAVAGQRGRSVLLLDHAARLAEKIRISGGGRCNFTNREVSVANFLSTHRDFARSVLSRYGPDDFVAMARRHAIDFHEKHRGQLFCDDSSERIIRMLVAECERGRVQWRRPVKVGAVTRDGTEAGQTATRPRFRVETDAGPVACDRVVVATGGLSIPKIGASDYAYRLARRLGLAVVEPRPALVPLVMAEADWAPFAALSGVSLPVDVRCDDGVEPGRFREDLLITHRGLSGPAGLQISSYWLPGATLSIDLAPGEGLAAALEAERASSRRALGTVLAQRLPSRFATIWAASAGGPDRRIAEMSKAAVRALAGGLSSWRLTPEGTEGYRKAEVTAGGIDTAELSQRTLEAHRVPGLHFVGEAVDVTGWLGGYNFQWAWSSGFVAGQAV